MFYRVFTTYLSLVSTCNVRVCVVSTLSFELKLDLISDVILYIGMYNLIENCFIQLFQYVIII